jgi:hypothetical protein
MGATTGVEERAGILKIHSEVFRQVPVSRRIVGARIHLSEPLEALPALFGAQLHRLLFSEYVRHDRRKSWKRRSLDNQRAEAPRGTSARRLLFGASRSSETTSFWVNEPWCVYSKSRASRYVD